MRPWPRRRVVWVPKELVAAADRSSVTTPGLESLRTHGWSARRDNAEADGVGEARPEVWFSPAPEVPATQVWSRVPINERMMPGQPSSVSLVEPLVAPPEYGIPPQARVGLSGQKRDGFGR
jgi:hypothetical protein